MKYVLHIFIIFIVFIILINLSFKVFNTMNPWLGILAGFGSICVFLYALIQIWKKSNVKQGKEED